MYSFVVVITTNQKGEYFVKKLFLLLCTMCALLSCVCIAHADSSPQESGGFYYILLEDGTIEITGTTKNEDPLVIPSTLRGYPVSTIGFRAFSYSSFSEIVISEGVTHIGSEAFRSANMKKITLPSTLLVIDPYAFDYCSELTSIEIPEGVTTVSTFKRCPKLTSITIPDSLIDFNWARLVDVELSQLGASTTPAKITISDTHPTFKVIDGVVFSKDGTELLYYPARVNNEVYTVPDDVISVARISNCGWLKELHLPESVKNFGGCFSCRNLATVTLPQAMESLGTFYNCPALADISMPATVTMFTGNTFQDVIGGSGRNDMSCAFTYCSSLTSINIPHGVTMVGDSTFKNCTSLTSVTIPDSVTHIGSEAFNGCTQLTSIVIPEGVTKIGDSAFCDCSALASVQFPSTLKEIGNSAFSCSGVTAIELPNGLESLGGRTFWLCQNLTSVVIPGSLKTFGGADFRSCKALTSVIVCEGVTDLGSLTFAECSSLGTIQLPASLKKIREGREENPFWQCHGSKTFIVPAGSYAQKFCKNKGYTYTNP